MIITSQNLANHEINLPKDAIFELIWHSGHYSVEGNKKISNIISEEIIKLNL